MLLSQVIEPPLQPRQQALFVLVALSHFFYPIYAARINPSGPDLLILASLRYRSGSLRLFFHPYVQVHSVPVSARSTWTITRSTQCQSVPGPPGPAPGTLSARSTMYFMLSLNVSRETFLALSAHSLAFKRVSTAPLRGAILPPFGFAVLTL